MNLNKLKKSSNRTFAVFFRNDARFIEIYKRFLKLDLLKQLSTFNTKKYDSQDYFKVLEHASLHNISITQTCDLKRALGERCPSAEQVLKCCRNNSSTTMINFMNNALFYQFNALPKTLQQHLKKSGIVFIDFHQDPYYGDKENPDVKKANVKASTTFFYEYLTADLYSGKGSFTIAITHRSPHEKIDVLVKRLLAHIEKVLSPRIIIFDGEFSSVAVLAELTRKKIKFLARKSRSSRIKAHLTSHYSKPDWENFRTWHPIELRSWRSRIKTVYVDVCPQNVKGEMKALIKSPGWAITPRYADKLYGKRFNIESGYRDKHKFQSFTTTKALSSRLLYILFAALLWNCWQALLIWVKTLKSYSKKLPRSLLITLTSTWIKILLNKALHS